MQNNTIINEVILHEFIFNINIINKKILDLTKLLVLCWYTWLSNRNFISKNNVK